MKRRYRSLILVPLVFAVACGEETTPTDPTTPAAPQIVRPTLVDTVSLGLIEEALPAALTNDTSISVAYNNQVTLVGGARGLFELTSTGFSEVDTDAVAAIVAYADSLVVANASGLYIYDGDLAQSPITDSLTGTINALAVRGTELWIGTTAGLYLFTNDELSSFDSTMAAKSLATFTGSSDIVVTTVAGQLEAYRHDGTNWIRRDLSTEGALDAVVPAAGGRMVGTSGGMLLTRVSIEAGKAGWQGQAIDSAPEAEAATGVQAIASDPTTGAVWAVDAAAMYRIESTGVSISKLQRPPSMGAVTAANVTSDGAIWLSDGTTLRRVGSAGEPVSYAKNIAPLSETNCNSCHFTPLGTGPMSLETLDQWLLFIDKSIVRVEDGTMPPSGPLTGSDADLVRRWKADGLRP